MGEDETGTRDRFNAHLHELIEPTIANGRGRIAKTTGDGLLVEFASVVDAVQCAVEIQTGMADRNADRAEGADAQDGRRIDFRIGVNLGDVIIEGDDIHGDGVNIAARLEGLADPGGVCLSEEVYRHLRGKVEFGFEDLGPRELKNIAEPVRAYRVLLRHGKSEDPEADTARPRPAAPAADMPSIAVLPFDNLSNDPEQEYFADGMVEEIITALSRFKWLLVMARNSSFTYKGRAVDARQVADELGVRYVLEGSVRRAGKRVRITGQLIDAANGDHIWADRFDGDMEDIFDLQDHVTASVVGAIEPSLRKAEIERARRKRPESLAAYDLFLHALAPLNRFCAEANTEALDFLERAIAIDPGYAPAVAYAAWCYEQRVLHGWTTAREDDAETAVRLAREALAIDSGDPGVIAMAGFVLMIVGHDYDSGGAACARSEPQLHGDLLDGRLDDHVRRRSGSRRANLRARLAAEPGGPSGELPAQRHGHEPSGSGASGGSSRMRVTIGRAESRCGRDLLHPHSGLRPSRADPGRKNGDRQVAGSRARRGDLQFRAENAVTRPATPRHRARRAAKGRPAGVRQLGDLGRL